MISVLLTVFLLYFFFHLFWVSIKAAESTLFSVKHHWPRSDRVVLHDGLSCPTCIALGPFKLPSRWYSYNGVIPHHPFSLGLAWSKTQLTCKLQPQAWIQNSALVVQLCYKTLLVVQSQGDSEPLFVWLVTFDLSFLEHSVTAEFRELASSTTLAAKCLHHIKVVDHRGARLARLGEEAHYP